MVKGLPGGGKIDPEEVKKQSGIEFPPPVGSVCLLVLVSSFYHWLVMNNRQVNMVSLQ